MNTHTNNKYAHKQCIHIYTERTCTQLRFMCLCWPQVGFSLRREKGTGKTPWWHWLTHFHETLSLMWPAGKPEDTHAHTHAHTDTHAQTACLQTLEDWGKKSTKCCWWLSLLLIPLHFLFLSLCLKTIKVSAIWSSYTSYQHPEWVSLRSRLLVSSRIVNTVIQSIKW